MKKGKKYQDSVKLIEANTLYDANEALELVEKLQPDVVLTDCEAALEALGELNGKHIRDDLVDTIFSRFCVGK